MPNFSGIWNATEQFQARAQNIWPATPGAPTIGTATAGTNNCASVTFTAPAYTGYPAGITNYTAISTPGCVTVSGASSPVVVTGLTTGTSYTFRVRANGAGGLSSPLSAASNSITATVATSAAFTSAGTFSWVAPTGVTSVAVVAIGGGSTGGGGLGYINSYSVTPGSAYTVVVGGGSSGTSTAGDSFFVNTSTVRGGGASGATGGTFTGTGGGNGGAFVGANGGGGGAAGYSGNGGNGGSVASCGAGGCGGGAGGGGGYFGALGRGAGSGGGVGIFGQGAGGSGGNPGFGGGGGSGGNNGTNNFVTGGCGCFVGAAGGGYGGGGSRGINLGNGSGASGAVRIVWAVAGVRGTPSFPSTNVGA